MTKISDYASFRSINSILSNKFVALKHSNHKVGSFDSSRKSGFSGFWKNPETEKIIYISTDMIPDRYGNVLIRTAKSDKDYTGGHNEYVSTKEDLIDMAVRLTK